MIVASITSYRKSKGDSMTIIANICGWVQCALFSYAPIHSTFHQPEEMGTITVTITVTITIITICFEQLKKLMHTAGNWKSQILDPRVLPSMLACSSPHYGPS